MYRLSSNDLELPPRSLWTSCGTQRLLRPLSGPCILLATAPTASPCFGRRPQSSPLQYQRKKLFFIERKPENLRIFWLSLFTGKVVEINGILPLSAYGRRAAEKMHLTGTARSVKKQFRNDRSRFGTANYKNNISADIIQNDIPPVRSF